MEEGCVPIPARVEDLAVEERTHVVDRDFVCERARDERVGPRERVGVGYAPPLRGKVTPSPGAMLSTVTPCVRAVSGGVRTARRHETDHGRSWRTMIMEIIKEA